MKNRWIKSAFIQGYKIFLVAGLMMVPLPWLLPAFLQHWAEPAFQSLCQQSGVGLKCKVAPSEMKWSGWRHPLTFQLDKLDVTHELGNISFQQVNISIPVWGVLMQEDTAMTFSVKNAEIDIPSYFLEKLHLQDLTSTLYVKGSSYRLKSLSFNVQEAKTFLSADWEGKTQQLILKGHVEGALLEHLAKRWPLPLAPIPRKWVTENLPKGVVEYADVSLKGQKKDGSWVIEDIHGTIRAQGVEVHYLGDLPPVMNTYGEIHYNKKDFNILAHGEAAGVSLEAADIKITDLDQKDQYINLDLKLSGPLPAALDLMTHRPLEFSQKLKLNPRKIKGTAETHLKLPPERVILSRTPCLFPEDSNHIFHLSRSALPATIGLHFLVL